MTPDTAVRRLLEAVRLGTRDLVGIEAAGAEGLLPLIGYERVGAWVWHRLRQGGALDATSSGFQQELRTLGMTQAAINLRIGAVTARVLTLLAAEGIHPVLLKGVACCALADRYPFFRYRQTADADLLVEPGLAERAWRLLRDAGFQPASADPGVHPDHHHLPTLISEAQVAVEIHASASFFWSSEESWRRFRTAAREVTWQGVPVLVPAPTEMLWHGVVHSLGDGHEGCRLRNFLTAAAMIADDEGVEWDSLARRVGSEAICDHDSRHPLSPAAIRRWLAAAAWLAGRDLPRGLGDGSAPAADLVRLLEFRKRRLETPPRSPRAQLLAERWLEEAARAQFGLGLGRLGHWQPRRGRPKRLASSLALQVLYRLTS